jgi:hypothetical protein
LETPKTDCMLDSSGSAGTGGASLLEEAPATVGNGRKLQAQINATMNLAFPPEMRWDEGFPQDLCRHF